MTPSEAIAALDHQLARHGQPIGFKRGSTIQSATGFVRGYKPEALAGLITQADRSVIVSPTSLSTYVPKANDDFNANGALGKVIAVEPIHIGATVVRYNVTVRMT
ncbi:hypothetical protein [Devosia sp. SD17-2]|uniref:hypothetical protein n=1 Tax=Devosia sp. SD17-2 TaxID=2976459 RepID=UPI0023D818A3|nr:hypothetical protein [Devosia sp. SD17-2]WEJ32194.1 hypothetical protein NYQ88_14970 [Devosia sp. SD17-2]